MRHSIIASLVTSLILFSSAASADNGLISVKSTHDVETTANKLDEVLKSKGMTVFARIDHAGGAKKVDIELRPTEVIIFGNPKIGSKLMACSQSTGIDLPQKALIHKDAAGDVWLSYNTPAYLNDRHNLEGCEDVINTVSGALAKFAEAATQ